MSLKPQDPGPASAPPPSVLLAGVAAGFVLIEAALWLAAGWVTAAAGLPFLAAAGIALAWYVAGAEVMDGQYRRELRMVRQRSLNMLGWSALVGAARSSSGNFEHAVKPEIQRLYAVRLAERYGVSLHAQPERAAEIVGPQLWPWIDPRRAPAQPAARPAHQALDRRSAAEPQPPPDAVLAALVDRLEQL
jgi:hypothetical protein